jgi:nucleoside-diphosphate-sugar epimerase
MKKTCFVISAPRNGTNMLCSILHNNGIYDITSPINLEVDEIYNLASPTSPIQYQIDPIQTFKTNVIGSLNLLELAKKK